jgi:hypothetical protein
MTREWKALRQCFPEHKNMGDLWRFRQAWRLDERAAVVVAFRVGGVGVLRLGIWFGTPQNDARTRSQRLGSRSSASQTLQLSSLLCRHDQAACGPPVRVVALLFQ